MQAVPSPNPNLITPSTFSYKDILVGKLARAVACSVISQLVILVIYIFIANINMFHPMEWMKSSLNTFTYLSTWLFVIIFISVIFAQCTICAKDYVLMSTYCSTRFQQYLHILSIHNFTLLILHILIGGALVWQILLLVDGDTQGLVVTCEGNQHCLVANNFFLILGGFWVGLYYFLKIYVSSKHLVFPVIQQKKFLQFRSNVLNIFFESFKISVTPTIYFAVFYYFWGNTFENQFMYTFNLEKLQIQSSVLAYVYCWWFSTLYIFCMNLMRFFFYLFLTESFQFPLVKESVHILTLQEAMLMNNLPIVQNLACLDLYLLSQWSPQRRQVFFTLSQPGGHPHNWNSLIESLLKLFNDYTDLLKKSSDNSMLQDNHSKPTNAVPPPFAPIRLQSPITSPETKFRNIRNMSYNTDYLDIVNVSHNIPVTANADSMKKTILEKIDKVAAFLKVFLGINFFFGELPQVNIQKCLSNGHLIVWGSQGIAELTSASLTEDKYGIVQKDLPVIITSLVHLKQSLDRLSKISALSRRTAGFDDFNYKMKNCVSAAVKRSLLSICLNFGDYFSDFPLSKEVLQYLQINVMLKNCS